MENFFAGFPRYGKIFSTLWKKQPNFSTQWKNFSPFFHTQWKEFVHTVENSDFRLFSGVFRLFSGGCGAEHAAPLVSRNARPTEGPRKTGPDGVGQRTQPRPHRVRRSERPFFRSRGRGFLAHSGETGALRASEDLLKGLLNILRGLRDHASEGRKARPQSRTRPRGRDGAGRGHESAPGRQAAVKQVAPSFTRSETLGASCRRPAAPSEPIFWQNSGRGGHLRPQSDRF